MNFLSLIEMKRDGKAFALGQIEEIVAVHTAGGIPDYQMAAFLMAVFFRGLNTAETTALTLAMRDSGDVLTFPNRGIDMTPQTPSGSVFCDDRGLSAHSAGTGTTLQ